MFSKYLRYGSTRTRAIAKNNVGFAKTTHVERKN
jgi:hypothetical protein